MARSRASDSSFPYTFSESKAVQICEFVEKLPHLKGETATPTFVDGKPVYPTLTLEPWQCWILTTVFGWRRLSDGRRRFRTSLIMVPRKNGKSFLSAAVMLFMLVCDGEAGAECYSVATTRDQAKAVQETAWGLANRADGFKAYFGVTTSGETKKSLTVRATSSKAEALSADAHTLDGLNVHFASVDELHAHKVRSVWDVITTATGARAQPLIWAITTAGVETGGICYEQMAYLHKLLDGALSDETYFGIEYTIDADDDWNTEAAWRKANPNYGVSVAPDDLERKAAMAAQSPASINNFLTKHLNVWVRAESTWMSMDRWLACKDETLTIEKLKQYPCWLGVDLAEVRDIAAVIALFKTPKGYAVLGKYYLPAETVQQSPIAQMSGWVRTGHLIETDGSAADYERIEDDIYAWAKSLKVEKVCFDQALAQQMGQSLTRRLGVRPPVETVSQNVAVMNPSMQAVMRHVLNGTFQHDGNPVLTWMFSNVVVEPNHKGEYFPRKAGGKDSANKIDGPMAIFTAMSQAEIHVSRSGRIGFYVGA